MEGLLELLIPLIRLLCYLVLIVLFFAYIARPLLNYLIINREIEQSKKIQEDKEVYHDPLSDGAGSDDNPPLNEPDGSTASVDSSIGIGSVTVTDKEVLNRLAASNPDKAGDLVKQWVHNE